MGLGGGLYAGLSAKWERGLVARTSDSISAPGTLNDRLTIPTAPADLPGPVFGLRLLALAIVAASGAALPPSQGDRLALAGGVLVGAALGLVQYVVTRRRLRVPAEAFILAQVATWTFITRAAGGAGSPVFVGYLLEVPLAAALLSRRGGVLAAIAGSVAFVALASTGSAPMDWGRTGTALGFLALIGLVTWIIAGLIDRQRLQIHASRQALRSRAESLAEELRLLGDYLGGALVGVDGLGRVTSLNPAGATLLGVGLEDSLGLPWQELLRTDRPGAAAITRTLSEGTSQRGIRITLETSRGTPIVVETEIWVSPTPEGRRTYLLMAPARVATDDPDPLLRLGEAAASVSHQIRNSLHALRGFAESLAEDPAVLGARSEQVNQLVRAIEGLGGLTEDVLAMGNPSRSLPEPVALEQTISSAVVLARRPGAHVDVRLPETPLYVLGRRGTLVHALFNLVDNACRVTPQGQQVEVRVVEDHGRAVVEIRDRGPGWSEQMGASRGPTASPNGHGYGLLATRRFLESSGGGLTFDSLPEGGTLCRVSLEIAPVAAS